MPTGKFTPVAVTGPNGEKWAGRGRKPKWLKEQEAATATVTASAPTVTTGQTTDSK